MNPTLLLLFGIGHVLGDFYFQSSKLAAEKETSFKHVFYHFILYLFTMVAVIVPVISFPLIRTAVIISLLHLLIDSLNFSYTRWKKQTEQRKVKVYLVNQALHLLIIVGAVMRYSLSAEKVRYIPIIERLINEWGGNLQHGLSWIFVILIVIQPCSVTIKRILNQYRPKDSDDYEDEGIPNAGALIGVFERFFIL